MRCYSCGREYHTMPQLMQHRKDTHGERCKNAMDGSCRFTQESCFLNHEQEGFRADRKERQPPEKAGRQMSQRQEPSQVGAAEGAMGALGGELETEPTPGEIMKLVQAQMNQAQAQMNQLTKIAQIVEKMAKHSATPTW